MSPDIVPLLNSDAPQGSLPGFRTRITKSASLSGDVTVERSSDDGQVVVASEPSSFACVSAHAPPTHSGVARTCSVRLFLRTEPFKTSVPARAQQHSLEPNRSEHQDERDPTPMSQHRRRAGSVRATRELGATRLRS